MRQIALRIMDGGQIRQHHRFAIPVPSGEGSLASILAISQCLLHRGAYARSLLTEECVGPGYKNRASLGTAFVDRGLSSGARLRQILANPGRCLSHIDARVVA